jgi:glycosyltransferase involved in cell wall biosynthesis
MRQILQINTRDIGGGAEKWAWEMLKVCREKGVESHLVVREKRSTNPEVIEIPGARRKVPWARICWYLYNQIAPFENRLPAVKKARYLLHTLAGGWAEIEKQLGREVFDYPGSRQLLNLVPGRPDMIHAHNLHGWYFDLNYLARLSQQIPVGITLHDEWLLTGHCSYSFDCLRWEKGCGHCPYLDTYPAIARDGTAHTWKHKHQIYQKAHFFITTPSQWLMDRVKRSMLASFQSQIIPYGIDLSIYHPADRQAARAALDLPQDTTVLLFVANHLKTSQFKDFAILQQVIARLALQIPPKSKLMLLTLGNEASDVQPGHIPVRHLPYEPDPVNVARFYQAADIFLHPARVDNFPLTIMETMACGTPVIASAVGGIPEQIIHGKTGYLAPAGDAEAFANQIQDLITDHDKCKVMGDYAASEAARRFDLSRQTTAYLDWYQDIITNEHR